MSRARTRHPESVRIDISGGDWILVKKHLTAGEQRLIYSRMMRADPAAIGVIDPLKVGIAKLLGYLLDWSFVDADGKPMVIRDQPEPMVTAQLDALDAETFSELVAVVDAHADAMRLEREREKNGQDGAIVSSPISPFAA